MQTKDVMAFCGKILGPGHPPFIVAEIGFNHNGDVGLAREMIHSAAENGADAVKFQTFIGEKIVSKLHMGKDPMNPSREIPIYEFFKRYELKKNDWKELRDCSKKAGIAFFSTPFDEGSVDLLAELGVPAIKIASGDLSHLPLIKHAAGKKLPIVLSTGMGLLGEIETALAAIRGAGNNEIILLHCVSNYPANHDEMNLACLPKMREMFDVPFGLSDHSMDNLSAVVATALGAVMIEKHFTIDRKLPGVDQAISITPPDLRELRTATADVVKILGDGAKKIQASEVVVKKIARRSLVAKQDIPKGTVLTREMIACKRPGTGIAPEHLDVVVGRTARRDIEADRVITWDLI